MALKKGTIRNDLKELVQESPMGQVKFIANEVLPEIGVNEKSGNIPVLSSSAGMKLLDIKRGKRGSFERAEWTWGDDSYTTYEYGYEEPIDNVEALENSEIFAHELISAQVARNQLFLAREKRVADAVFNTTTFTAAGDSHTITEEWDDATNADPILDIVTAHGKLFVKTGVPRSACHLLINETVLRNILVADALRDNSKYTINLDTFTLDAGRMYLAKFLGIADVHVATSFYGSTNIGVQDDTFAGIWSNEYGMLYVPCAGNSWRIPGLGRQPVYKKFAPDYKIETYDEEQTDSRIVRVRDYRGEYINTRYGVLMDNITA